MEPKTTQEKKILEIYNSLPKIIQDAIMKSVCEKIIRNIVNKYDLRIDQGTQLENMTFALMMGQMTSKDYFDSILEDFNLEDVRARELFQEIDDSVFAKIQDVVLKLEKEKEIEAQKEAEKVPEKSTFMKEGVGVSGRADEILTVTRDELLRDIEDSTDEDNKGELPDLNDSNVMPKAGSDAGQIKKEVSGTPQIPESPQMKTPETSIEIKEKEIPSNLPTEEKQDEGPVDPVEAGLNNRVSTSNKTYQASDPYRESLK